MWKIIGASVTGTTHEAAGTGCQDASDWRANHDLTCLAVADGAGSRPRCGQGAALAVEQGILLAEGYARRSDPGDPATWLPQVFEDVRRRIIALAAAEGNQSGDYATTVALAVVTGDVVCVGQVGDSIAVLGCGGRYETVTPEPTPTLPIGGQPSGQPRGCRVSPGVTLCAPQRTWLRPLTCCTRRAP